jgi:membrane-associated protease RseP (regulator of RpoE activity)
MVEAFVWSVAAAKVPRTGRHTLGAQRRAYKPGSAELSAWRCPQRRLSASKRPALVASIATEAGVNLTGVFILAGTVVIHELGHFLAARLQGIKVKGFSIGFGPRLFSFRPKNSETEFAIRLLPLGGFVAFPEDYRYDEESKTIVKNDDPDLLQNRPLMQRALVIAAGVLANIALAWTLLFTSVETVGAPRMQFETGVSVPALTDMSAPAAKAGLKPGDVIVAVNGQALAPGAESALEAANMLRRLAADPQHKPIELQLSDGRVVRVDPEGGRIGVQLVPNAKVSRERVPLRNAVPETNKEFVNTLRNTINGFITLFSNLKENSKELSGPLGVASIGAEIARHDASVLLQFAAVISLNLGIINALPLPALDGGQMAFLIVEAIRGKPLPRNLENAINGTALTLLLVMSGFLLIGDLERIQVLSWLMNGPSP